MTYFINDNGREIQISEDILITKQVASFKDFKIKGDFSVSFTVPNTSENRETLGYYGFNQLNSPVFSSTGFNLVKNGVILMRGLMVIEEDRGNELSLYFISGNSNWFKNLEFNCRDIRTDRYSQTWSRSNVSSLAGGTEGIVFPIIDWAYKGQKADEYIYFAYSGDSSSVSATGGNLFVVMDYFPCLFVHTLLNEIAIHSGIKITGNLLSDKFFKSLILTPDSPDIVNPETDEILNPLASETIKVQMIAPNIKALDFIKWVCMTFSIVPVYDTFSNTLTLDLLDRKNLATASDWSEYVKSYNIKYDQVENNYITLKESSEANYPQNDIGFIAEGYNQVNDLKLGEANIQSSKEDGQINNLYQSPFPICYDSISDVLETSVPFIPMYELEDDQAYTINEIDLELGSGLTSYLKIIGIGFPLDESPLYLPLIARIEDSNNLYTGYRRIWRDVLDTGFYFSNTQLGAFGSYVGNSTGQLFTQNVKKGKPGTRVLSFVPSISHSDLTNTQFRSGIPSSYSSLSTVGTAYFHKPVTPYANLNKYKQGLSYGPITDYNDQAISDTYWRFLKSMVTNPTIRTTMLLPEAEFVDFDWQFIYLNTGNLNGYFFVDSIVNYKDATTPVEVNLLTVSNYDYPQVEVILNNYSMTADKGTFSQNGLAATLTFTPLSQDLSFEVQTIDALGVYACAFTNTTGTKTLNQTGTGTDTDTIAFGDDVGTTVTKTTNATDITYVFFYKDGVQMDSQSISQGNPINVSYTYTGLVGGESLEVLLTEG